MGWVTKSDDSIWHANGISFLTVWNYKSHRIQSTVIFFRFSKWQSRNPLLTKQLVKGSSSTISGFGGASKMVCYRRTHTFGGYRKLLFCTSLKIWMTGWYVNFLPVFIVFCCTHAQLAKTPTVLNALRQSLLSRNTATSYTITFCLFLSH